MKAPAYMINYNCYTNQVHFYDGSRVLVLNSREIDYLEFITGENTSSIFKQIFLEDKKMSFLIFETQKEIHPEYHDHFLG